MSNTADQSSNDSCQIDLHPRSERGGNSGYEPRNAQYDGTPFNVTSSLYLRSMKIKCKESVNA